MSGTLKISGKWKTKTIVFFVVLACTIPAKSQAGVQDTTAESNIISYKQRLNVYLFGIQKFSNFEIKNKEQEKKLKYVPNESLSPGVGFNYKWLGFSAAFNLGLHNEDKELYGETNSLDLQLDIYSKKYLFNAYFLFYESYYWKNPKDFFPSWNIKDSALVMPEIKTATFGFSAIHILNYEDFSFKAAYQNVERQVSSAGSWLVGLKFSIYGIASDSSIVPGILHSKYPNAVDFSGLNAINLGTAFGYTYTFIFSEFFYFNAALMIGINLQAVSTRRLNGELIKGDGKISSNAMFKSALGCNKPKLFYGITFSSDSFLVKNPNDTEFTYNYGKLRIFYGLRFNVGKK